MKNQRAIWITQTGIFLAILIVAQIVTKSIPIPPPFHTVIPGTVNNMLFILAVMLCGISSAAVLAVVSPCLATLLGIGPIWPFVPVIVAGNIVLVVLWYLIALRHEQPGKLRMGIALVSSAAVKFLVLFIGIINLLAPLILGISVAQAKIAFIAFFWPQLITAAVGGIIAILIYPQLKKALPKIRT